GMPAISPGSRGSASAPGGLRSPHEPDPGGVAAPSRYDPSGGDPRMIVPGGIAALNHRLMATTPPGSSATPPGHPDSLGCVFGPDSIAIQNDKSPNEKDHGEGTEHGGYDGGGRQGFVGLGVVVQ